MPVYWTVLAGFAVSYGVLQEYYTTTAELKGNIESLGIIGTTLNVRHNRTFETYVMYWCSVTGHNLSINAIPIRSLHTETGTSEKTLLCLRRRAFDRQFDSILILNECMAPHSDPRHPPSFWRNIPLQLNNNLQYILSVCTSVDHICILYSRQASCEKRMRRSLKH